MLHRLPQRVVPFQIELARPVSEVRASLVALGSQKAGLLSLRRSIHTKVEDTGLAPGMRVHLQRNERGQTVTMEGTLRANGIGQSVLEGEAAVDQLAWYLPLILSVIGIASTFPRSVTSLSALPGMLLTALPGVVLVFALLYTIHVRARTMLIRDVERALQATDRVRF